MKRVRLLGLVFLAIFALGAVVSATASAEEMPNMLPGEGKEGTQKATSGTGTLETASGKAVTCSKDEGSGKSTTKKLGEFDILFSPCNGSFGSTCWGLDDKESLLSVLVLGTWHLRYYSLPSHTVAIIFLIKHVHLWCKAGFILILILLLGCVAGKLTPTGTLTTKFTATLNQTKGKNEITVVDTEDNKSTEKCELTIQGGEKGTPEGAGLAFTEAITTEKEALIMA
jgi:hypothetical protein